MRGARAAFRYFVLKYRPRLLAEGTVLFRDISLNVLFLMCCALCSIPYKAWLFLFGDAAWAEEALVGGQLRYSAAFQGVACHRLLLEQAGR